MYKDQNNNTIDTNINDTDTNDTDTNNTNNIKNKKNKHLKYIFGLCIFLLVFVIILPIVFYNLQLYRLLEVYLPNVDLIGNVLTWTGGPYGIWNSLYKDDETIMQFTSETILNYIALLGLTFIVARETRRNKSIIKGWSFAFVMLLLTYLLPSDIARYIMNKFYELSVKLNFGHIVSKTIGFLSGVICTLCFLFLEMFVLSQFRSELNSFVKNLHNTVLKFKL